MIAIITAEPNPNLPGPGATVSAWFVTPLAGLIRAPRAAFATGASRPWGAYDIISFIGMWGVSVNDRAGNNAILSILNVSGAHIPVSVFLPALQADEFDTMDWGTDAAPLVQDLESGGVPTVDANEAIVIDAAGDPVWATVPQVDFRFTSSVAHAGGASVTYTYEIENFRNEDFEFSFPEITSPAHPSGWSGTVAANSSETISFAQDGDIVGQQSQASLHVDGNQEATERQYPVQCYMPVERAAYSGSCNVVNAYYDGVQDVNRIEFTVSEVSECAVMVRGTDESGMSLVAEVEGPLVPGVTYTCVDPAFEPGVNSYLVRAGTGPNGANSDQAEVLNQ